MQRILIVSPSPSHPATQGNRRRIQEIGRIFLEQGNEVHFLWLAEEWSGIIGVDQFAEMQAFWSSLFVVPAQGLFTPQITELSAGTQVYLDWLQTNYDYDLVWVHYAWYGAVCIAFEPFEAVRVIDTHDRLADRNRLMKAQKIDQVNFFSLSKGQEALALRKADLVIACQPQDEFFFTDAYLLDTVRTIGQPMPEFRGVEEMPQSSREESSSIHVGFIGSDNAVNKEALKRVLEAISARKNDLPEGFKLILAGKMTDSVDLSIYGLDKFLGVLGVVRNVEDFYAKLDAVLVPLSFGTGLKVKAVESMASGLPVLATKHATIGLQVVEPEHCYASEFELVAGLVSLLNEPPESRSKVLSRLQSSSISVINQYRNQTASQLKSVISEIDKIRTTRKQPRMLTEDGLGVLDETEGPLFIYGAGQGGAIVWAGLSSKAQKRVHGFIDQAPSQTELFLKPVIKPDRLSPESRAKAIVVVALMTSQAEKVRNILELQGYKECYSARRYIRRRMLSLS